MGVGVVDAKLSKNRSLKKSDKRVIYWNVGFVWSHQDKN